MGGSINDTELSTFFMRFPHLKAVLQTFVETGTYRGDTCRLASRYFKQVHTIEIHNGLHLEAQAKSAELGLNNIHHYLGDSATVLPLIAKATGASVWFLDAHISGQDSGWNSNERVPLITQLRLILRNNLHPGAFIFDDHRFFGNVWDWMHVTEDKIKEVFRQFNRKIVADYVLDDRYYVVVE